jgi:cytoskeleton protein RodZ
MNSRRSRRSDDTDNTGNILPLSPGKRLQKAREALNLSISDVAARLRMREGIIQAVEDDQYEGIPPVYARGYLRSYGRLVSLEPEGLIKAYEDIADMAPESLHPVTSPDLRQAAVQGENLVHWLGYAAFIITSVGLLAWWQSREVEIPQPTSSFVSGAGDPALAQETPSPSAEPGSAGSDSTHEVIVLSGETSPSGSAYQPEEPAQGTADSQAQDALGVSPEGETAGETLAQLSQQTDVNGLAFAGGPRLVLQLSGDSWNQVIDNQGNRVAHGLAKGGESIQIYGEPPFKAVIGNSPGVTVLYDGKPVDISSFSRGSVARFTLEADGRLGP